MSILKWQINSISNFASFFIVIMHNSPLNFKLIHFLLSIKRSNESPNFKNFVCYGENSPNSSYDFPNHKSVFFSNFASHSSVMKYSSSVISLAQTFYTFVKSSPLRCKYLRLSSSRVEICQIPYVTFEMSSQFLFRFFIILQCH